MNTQRASKGALAIAGVLVLLYIGYGLTRPVKAKARAQRITAVNAAPRITLSFPLSNASAPAGALPNKTK